nr:immunoglobulin heavy chain junction region [Mus musculus]
CARNGYYLNWYFDVW